MDVRDESEVAEAMDKLRGRELDCAIVRWVVMLALWASLSSSTVVVPVVEAGVAAGVAAVTGVVGAEAGLGFVFVVALGW